MTELLVIIGFGVQLNILVLPHQWGHTSSFPPPFLVLHDLTLSNKAFINVITCPGTSGPIGNLISSVRMIGMTSLVDTVNNSLENCIWIGQFKMFWLKSNLLIYLINKLISQLQWEKNTKSPWNFHREISFREVFIYYSLPKCNFFVQLIDTIVPSCKIKNSNLKTLIETEIFMQCIEERRKTPSISGIRLCSVLGISRIILYSQLKGRKMLGWRDFRDSQAQCIRNCGLYTCSGPAKSMPKQRSRFCFCVKLSVLEVSVGFSEDNGCALLLSKGMVVVNFAEKWF